MSAREAGSSLLGRLRARARRILEHPRVAPAASFLRDLAGQFREDRVTGLAAEVAFWWVLTLFPAMLVLAATLGSIDQLVDASVEAPVEERIVEALAEFTGSEDNEAVEEVRRLFGQRSAGLFTIAVVLALWSTSRSFTALIYALDDVYDLEDQRSYLRIRGLGLLLAVFTLIAGAIAMALIVVGPLLGRGGDVAEAVGLGGDRFAAMWNLLRLPVAAVVLVAFHASIYHFAPNHRTPWRWDLPGAVVAAVFWGLASVGFRTYLSLSADGSLVVGALGGALTLMLWLYVLAVGMLVGGEVNAILAQRRDVAEPRPTGRIRRWLRGGSDPSSLQP